MANRQPHNYEQQPNEDGDGGIFINLEVPHGAEAGVDSLTFEYGGSEFDVLVPAGSLPGDVLRIQVGRVGADGDCEADDNGDLDGKADAKNVDENNKFDADVGGSNKEPMDRCSCGSEDKPTSSLNGTRKRPSLLSELGGLANDSKADNITTKRLKSGSDADSARATTRDNNTVVALGDGLIQGQDANVSITLHLSESIAEVSNNIKRNSNNHIGDGTHGMVWASGTVLAQALTSSFGLEFLKEMFSRCDDSLHEHGNNQSIARRNLNCLELGSGLGVCGLALAHALNRLCVNSECVAAKRATILLTDHGEREVELLRKNIQRNLPPSFCGRSNDTTDRQCMNSIDAQPLVWGDALQSTSNLTMADKLRYNLILGSDILYNTHESYDPLVNTIQRYLHPHGGTIMLAVRWRKPDLEREFFRMMEERCKGLKFELWKEFIDDKDFGGRRCPCVLNWKDYGNPDCEVSNRHFHETKICIENKQTASKNVPLANVTERDMELMTDDEYSKFEELQVQIYVGRYA